MSYLCLIYASCLLYVCVVSYVLCLMVYVLCVHCVCPMCSILCMPFGRFMCSVCWFILVILVCAFCMSYALCFMSYVLFLVPCLRFMYSVACRMIDLCLIYVSCRVYGLFMAQVSVIYA